MNAMFFNYEDELKGLLSAQWRVVIYDSTKVKKTKVAGIYKYCDDLKGLSKVYISSVNKRSISN